MHTYMPTYIHRHHRRAQATNPRKGSWSRIWSTLGTRGKAFDGRRINSETSRFATVCMHACPCTYACLSVRMCMCASMYVHVCECVRSCVLNHKAGFNNQVWETATCKINEKRRAVLNSFDTSNICWNRPLKNSRFHVFCKLQLWCSNHVCEKLAGEYMYGCACVLKRWKSLWWFVYGSVWLCVCMWT
jgi:hypothetical protein